MTERIDPPETRIIQNGAQIVEFYEHLGVPGAERRILDRAKEFLEGLAPTAVFSLTFSYLAATDENPDMVLGVFVIGDAIDMG